MGILELHDGRNALLKSKPTGAQQGKSTQQPEESSGGLTVVTDKDMPDLQALLEAHAVKSAVLLAEREVVLDRRSQPGSDATSAPRTWKEREEARLKGAVIAASREAPLDEDLVLLAAMNEEQLDSFLRDAHGYLMRSYATEDGWAKLLARHARRAFEDLQHHPLDMALEGDLEDNQIDEPMPLFALEDLSVRFTRGALGGPAPLAAR